MSKRFHVSEDGEPRSCSASEGNCPLGGEHFSTVEEAREGYAREMAGSLLPQAAKRDSLMERFKEVDSAYWAARTSWEDPTAWHNHTEESMALRLRERDLLAARLGLPSADSVEAERVEREASELAEREARQARDEALAQSSYDSNVASIKNKLERLKNYSGDLSGRMEIRDELDKHYLLAIRQVKSREPNNKELAARLALAKAQNADSYAEDAIKKWQSSANPHPAEGAVLKRSKKNRSLAVKEARRLWRRYK